MKTASILIVEDESIIAAVIKSSLLHFGYEVMGPAASGEEALALAGQSRPDLVLMDIHLEGAMDGIDAAQEMRVRFRVPVVFLSAYAEDPTLLRAKLVEPYGYILKPFENRNLRITIEMALYMHQQEEKLRIREGRLNFLMSSIPALIHSSRSSGDFRVTFVSDSVWRLFGYAASEFIEDSGLWRSLLHPEDAARAIANLELAHRTGSAESEYRLRHQDGTYRWVSDQIRLVGDAASPGSEMIGILVDITERKEMESALRQTTADLHALSVRLQAVREEERATIARELHDSLGQHLTGLQIGLMWADRQFQAGKPSEFSAIHDQIVSMVPIVERLTEQTQTICTTLRSSVLDDLGLAAAIEWQVADTAKRSGLKFSLALPGDQEIELDADLALGLFRILQEALTNVLRHARATQIDVGLSAVDGAVELVIADNGRGFTPGTRVGTKALGLLGMRERASGFGGTVEFLSEPNKGCIVRVRVPASTKARLPEPDS